MGDLEPCMSSSANLAIARAAGMADTSLNLRIGDDSAQAMSIFSQSEAKIAAAILQLPEMCPQHLSHSSDILSRKLKGCFVQNAIKRDTKISPYLWLPLQ